MKEYVFRKGDKAFYESLGYTSTVTIMEDVLKGTPSTDMVEIHFDGFDTLLEAEFQLLTPMPAADEPRTTRSKTSKTPTQVKYCEQSEESDSGKDSPSDESLSPVPSKNDYSTPNAKASAASSSGSRRSPDSVFSPEVENECVIDLPVDGDDAGNLNAVFATLNEEDDVDRADTEESFDDTATATTVVVERPERTFAVVVAELRKVIERKDAQIERLESRRRLDIAVANRQKNLQIKELKNAVQEALAARDEALAARDGAILKLDNLRNRAHRHIRGHRA
jgi:hypothetical protein